MVNVSLEEEWLGKFFKFLTNTTFNSTYKLVFMKSFLELGNRENSQDWIKIGKDVTRVELDFIAVPYIKYYWEYGKLNININYLYSLT